MCITSQGRKARFRHVCFYSCPNSIHLFFTLKRPKTERNSNPSREIARNSLSMSSSSLLEVWEAAASNPFHPIVSKDSQFYVGFTLLLAGMVLLLLGNKTALLTFFRAFIDRRICPQSIHLKSAPFGATGFNSVRVRCEVSNCKLTLTVIDLVQCG